MAASRATSPGKTVSSRRMAALAGATDAVKKLAYPLQNGHFLSGFSGAAGAREIGSSRLPLRWQSTGAKAVVSFDATASVAGADVAWETMWMGTSVE